MPTVTRLSVEKLSIDLKNFRTVPQKNEQAAVHAMIATDPAKFWGLMDSVIEDGFTPTENIIVLKGGKSETELIVAEGNRRTAVLKLCFGHLSHRNLDVPPEIVKKLGSIAPAWKKSNVKVPCVVHEASEAAAVDRIVARVHGKGDKASRAEWVAVATARHNRTVNNGSEPGLDILEKYLKHGKNLTGIEKERWAGDYPLSVLDEALKKLAPRVSKNYARDLADAYPKIHPHLKALDSVILKIGRGEYGFHTGGVNGGGVRGPNFAEEDGIPVPTPPQPPAGSVTTTSGGGTTPSGTPSGTTTPSSPSGSAGAVGSGSGGQGKRKPVAYPTDDPRTVRRILKKFVPHGHDRQKIATLVGELSRMDIKRMPHAFCFVLRSVFEISAKLYCKDHAASGGPKTQDSTGNNRYLRDILKDVANHLAIDPANPAKKLRAQQQLLHGASVELGKADGFLSVTSMNALVHSPHFSADVSSICTLFGNIFPLLREMNS